MISEHIRIAMPASCNDVRDQFQNLNCGRRTVKVKESKLAVCKHGSLYNTVAAKDRITCRDKAMHDIDIWARMLAQIEQQCRPNVLDCMIIKNDTHCMRPSTLTTVNMQVHITARVTNWSGPEI